MILPFCFFESAGLAENNTEMKTFLLCVPEINTKMRTFPTCILKDSTDLAKRPGSYLDKESVCIYGMDR